MTLKTFYTAVGRLERRRDGSGSCPIVRLGGWEYMLDLQEMAVWTSLNWRIARREEIGALYRALWQGCGYRACRSLEECIDRLVTRGLLVCGIGETEYDALYDLISALYIVPACGALWLRILTFLKLTLLDGVSFRAARRLFARDTRTAREAQVMRLAGQALLSTAEIIRCVDKGVLRLPSEQSILDAVYSDRDTTSDNIACTVKALPGTRDVTLAVANLYLRRQILFERV